MTSDAKIGLLLGLVFIFIIAFILNGLPSFKNQQNSNELTTNMAHSQNNPPGVGTNVRKASRQVITRIEPVQKPSAEQPAQVQAPSTGAQEVRFKTKLPELPAIAKGPAETKPTALIQRKTPEKTKSKRPALARVYRVQDGDSLAVIAKRFYGDQEGNRNVNIARIFKANRKILRSADQIYIGQKLIIPPLSSQVQAKDRLESVFSTTGFRKVESIGKRHPAGNNKKTTKSKYYVVREDDSLWKIALEKLDNGNRYPEIVRLNAGILQDEDNLAVGLRLKLPSR